MPMGMHPRTTPRIHGLTGGAMLVYAVGVSVILVGVMKVIWGLPKVLGWRMLAKTHFVSHRQAVAQRSLTVPLYDTRLNTRVAFQRQSHHVNQSNAKVRGPIQSAVCDFQATDSLL